MSAGKEEFRRLILENEQWLMERVLHYAKRQGYTEYTSTLAEAWRMSIQGLSESLIQTIDRYDSVPELYPDEDYTEDPAANFGIVEARLHRSRGITLSMFMGLMKYYQQSYLDLVEDSRAVDRRLFVERFFDRVEIGFCQEWSSLSNDFLIVDLQHKNRLLTNEKNKYLTLFESAPGAMFFLDTGNKINNLNYAASRLLTGKDVPGAYYYGTGRKKRKFPWFARDVQAFVSASEDEKIIERGIKTKRGSFHFLVQMRRMLDVSRKFTGIAVILNDITELKRTEERLAVERKNVLAILNNAPLGIMAVNEAGKITYINERFTDLFGYGIEDIPDGRTWFRRAYPDREYRRNTISLWKHDFEQPKNVNASPRVLYITARDGVKKTVRTLTVRLPSGEFITTFDDITEQITMERALGESENKFETLVENSIAGVYIVQDRYFRYVNKRFAEIHGYAVEEITDRLRPRDVIHPEDYPAILERAKGTLPSDAGSSPLAFRIVRKDGVTRHVEIFGSRMMYRGKQAITGTLVDISGRVAAEEKIKEMAYHDILTGLPNRALLHDRTIIAFASARRSKKKVALMMLDLDKFKDVNDTHGHDAGDLFLKSVAATMKEVLRKSDTVARIGGDEFMVLLPDLKRIDDSARVASKILDAFRTPVSINGHALKITSSIGISIFPDDADTIEEMMKRADAAMYRAKELGRNRVVFFGKE